jgi:hypothetical protein
LRGAKRPGNPDTVIPGRCQRVRAKRGPMTGSASNPESRDSPMRNCASEVWSGACHRAARSADPLGPSRNDDCKALLTTPLHC